MVNGNRRGGTRTEVYSIRLTHDEVARIQRLAKQADVPASALVRDWVRRGLATEDDTSVSAAMDTIQRDVDQLKRRLAHT